MVFKDDSNACSILTANPNHPIHAKSVGRSHGCRDSFLADALSLGLHCSILLRNARN